MARSTGSYFLRTHRREAGAGCRFKCTGGMGPTRRLELALQTQRVRCAEFVAGRCSAEVPRLE